MEKVTKVFESIPYGRLIAKMYVYGFSRDAVITKTKTDLLNFVAITAAERTTENLISTLETESQATIEWFELNKMILCPEKLQAIVVKKNERLLSIEC